MRIKALVLTAGLGARLRPLTGSIPKCLAPVHGHPLLDHILDALADVGAEQVLLNSHPHTEVLTRYLRSLGDIVPPDWVRVAHEERLLGSLGTLRRHRAWAEDADVLIVAHGDNFFETSLRSLLERHRAHGEPATMTLFAAPDPRACGIATLDDAGRVTHFVEKPDHPPSPWANAGLYAFSSRAVTALCDAGGDDLARHGLPTLVGRMMGFVGGWQRDIGTWAGYREAQGRRPRRQVTRWPRPRPAVFLDRDGTLIRDVPYLADPEGVELLPGVGAALRALRDRGFALVVVSNQSGVGRGLITPQQLEDVNARVTALLRAEGVHLDGVYTCPHAPRTTDRRQVEHYERKPGPGMLVRAAAELRLDLERSWMVGDRISDVLAGRAAGCAGSIWLGDAPAAAAEGFPASVDLAEAAARILRARPPDAAARRARDEETAGPPVA